MHVVKPIFIVSGVCYNLGVFELLEPSKYDSSFLVSIIVISH